MPGWEARGPKSLPPCVWPVAIFMCSESRASRRAMAILYIIHTHIIRISCVIKDIAIIPQQKRNGNRLASITFFYFSQLLLWDVFLTGGEKISWERWDVVIQFGPTFSRRRLWAREMQNLKGCIRTETAKTRCLYFAYIYGAQPGV